jgi:hypothetical protein
MKVEFKFELLYIISIYNVMFFYEQNYLFYFFSQIT